MKALDLPLLLAIGALAIAGTALAQVPTGNDTSDTNGNTGMGTHALGGPAAANAGLNNTASGWYALYYTTGDFNSGFGEAALFSNTSGTANTALGANALYSNTTGGQNTATGSGALHANNGSSNTATGASALNANTTGTGNTATGVQALTSNIGGGYNTATGQDALWNNTTGNYNTASGEGALFSNTTGINNTAYGSQALYSNEGSANNTAFGYQALYTNVTGGGNAAQGYLALFSNTSGSRNLAIGNNALARNTRGSYNIGLGFQGGLDLTTGTDNIDIANVGVAGESQTLRLGTEGTAGVAGSGILSTYIAGITGSTVTGSAVYVSSSGQLGVLASSERYKTDITPLGRRTAKLRQLRPVSFRLKSDPSGTVQYGLIAEEVARVYPELVIRGADGRINGVRYEELTPMLLNEVQQQAAEIRELKQQQKQFATQLQAALAGLRAKDRLLAQR